MTTIMPPSGTKVAELDDPFMTPARATGKLVMGILALIAEFENDIRRERQMAASKGASTESAWGESLFWSPQQFRKLRS
jgi:DNA invertase Pin-like site-specific DNA recombinase